VTIERELERRVFSLLPSAAGETLVFESKFPGVEFATLYRSEGGSSAAILRYAPGARVPPHRHVGYEHVYVLEGSQCDERGEYTAGTLVVNPPGTQHEVHSPNGCVVLVIWQQPIAFL